MPARRAPHDGVSGAVLERFGADCPVPPAVWRQFTTPDSELDLILELRDQASGPMVARQLLQRLRSADRTPDILTVSPFVVVSVTLSEVVSAILPYTRWLPLIKKAATLSRRDVETELGDLDGERPLRAREGWETRDVGQLRWTLSQLRRVLGRRATAARVVALFRDAAEMAGELREAPIRTVGVNRVVGPAVLESRVTVKADAAERVFDIDASDITWAVVDSGIDKGNPAFLDGAGASRVICSFDVPWAVQSMREEDATTFVGLEDNSTWEKFARLAAQHTPTASDDPLFRHHGTHVAGILAADERSAVPPPNGRPPLVGVCPTLRLVDLRVFDEQGHCEEIWVLVALRFIRWLNDRLYLARRIDGVNLSISTPYAVDSQPCGWTPVCIAADELVESGVVVVAAAGNEAYDESMSNVSLGTGFRFLSVTDPGNARLVITVGATDKTSPYRVGPIASSGRGPTADGRHKPDLLAPGKDILSTSFEADPQAFTGTSQAAPHVSGVAAMILARYDELRGQPLRLKQVLCETANDLDRVQDFQGNGLVDALRALQRI